MAESMLITLRAPDGMDREFVDLVGRCYLENPDKKDLRELRKYLAENLELYKIVFDMSEALRMKLTENLVEQEAGQLAIKANIEKIHLEMKYDIAPMLEKLLIDNVINCWLRLNWLEFQLAGQMNRDRVSTSYIEYWEKRLSATQRRYLRACETLARVRKLTRNTPMLQVNIASEGGQQVNVAGDLVTQSKKDEDSICETT
jgi:hypothetical protein